MARDASTSDEPRVYFEHVVIGASARVSAIDAATGVEVAVVGPAGADRTHLERLALAKLRKRLSGPA